MFLTTDLHANIANDVFIDKHDGSNADRVRSDQRTDPTNTYKDEILNAFPAMARARSTALQAVLSLQGVDCRALDVYSYQLVDVNADAGTLTVSSRDKDGNVVSDDVDSDDEVHQDVWSVARDRLPHSTSAQCLGARRHCHRHAVRDHEVGRIEVAVERGGGLCDSGLDLVEAGATGGIDACRSRR